MTKETFQNGILIALFLCMALSGCSNEVSSQKEDKPSVESYGTFAKGADISWLPRMVASGYQFYNDSGEKEDCFLILKDHGINSIRLRTFVNPSDGKFSGHCAKEETVACRAFACPQRL